MYLRCAIWIHRWDEFRNDRCGKARQCRRCGKLQDWHSSWGLAKWYTMTLDNILDFRRQDTGSYQYKPVIAEINYGKALCRHKEYFESQVQKELKSQIPSTDFTKLTETPTSIGE